jgi:hypothetical protein
MRSKRKLLEQLVDNLLFRLVVVPNPQGPIRPTTPAEIAQTQSSPKK